MRSSGLRVSPRRRIYFKTRANDLELRFAKSAHKDVAGDRVLFKFERAVFFEHTVKTVDDFVFFAGLHACYRKADNRFGEVDGGKSDFGVGRAKGVADVGGHEFRKSADIACHEFVRGFLFLPLRT